MDRLTHRVVASERERHVGHATRAQGVGQVVADIGTGLDEVDGVVVVLFDTGGDGEDVRVEDDVFWREAHFVDQDVIAALADFLLARGSVGLADFVESHDHHGSAIALAQAGVVLELLDAFLHGNGVDDALALMHLRPASITSHLDESIMIGTREMSGSPAIRLRNRTMAAWESSIPSSMLMSIT